MTRSTGNSLPTCSSCGRLLAGLETVVTHFSISNVYSMPRTLKIGEGWWLVAMNFSDLNFKIDLDQYSVFHREYFIEKNQSIEKRRCKMYETS